jgi:D-proline reductase (dithiol) PrdB
VPFELGRPLGVPNDSAFQKKVLRAALSLLEKDQGPVLEDFPEDAPESDAPVMQLSCPVSFPGPEVEASEPQKKREALKQEILSLTPWYDLAIQKRARTTVGVSGVAWELIPDFLCAFLTEETPENPNTSMALPQVLNLAVDDLKAFYTEAITAQPGQSSPSSQVLSDWFWNETLAGKIIFEIRDACKKNKDPFLRIVGNVLLIPAEQVNKRKT